VSTTLTETDVLDACRTLFGEGPDISKGFLHYLQPGGARSAYRKKAKETHPDFFYSEDQLIQQQQTDLFRRILEAYEVVNRFFNERNRGLWSPSAPFTQSASRSHWPGRQQQRPTNSYNASNTARRQQADDYYQGPIPYSVLEFGRYLYYTGHISYWSLIQAITWQRKQRPVIGSVALRWGWLLKGSFERILAASHIPGRFGEKAVKLGLLSDFQVRTLLYYQRTQQERIGNYFTGQNLLTAEHLELLIQKLIEHNALVLSLQKRSQRPLNPFS
jgi:hypothetical protein